MRHFFIKIAIISDVEINGCEFDINVSDKDLVTCRYSQDLNDFCRSFFVNGAYITHPNRQTA
jgi:hypothetical protein